MFLAVNGSLMSGLELDQNLLDAGAIFVRQDRTGLFYQLWSIKDRYPGMVRTNSGNSGAISLEIWDINEVGIIRVLEREPAGLVLGRVVLESGDEVLGILAEPYIVEGMLEITSFGGWRNYLNLLLSK